MTTFYYRAKKGSTETVTGQIEAQNQNEAIELLNQQGLLPISVEEKGAKTSTQKGAVQKRVSSKEIYFFSRQLASLIKAGIPILRALNLVSAQTSNATLKHIMMDIEKGISDGVAFSDCLSRYPIFFNAFYIAMVKTGEESGNLKEVLLRISDYQRSQQEISSKVKTALAYPVLMAIVGLCTIIFILAYVMPKITVLFSDVGEQLPIPTKILLTASQILREGWLWIALGIAGATMMIQKASQTPAGRLTISRLRLKGPLFGNLILKIELARFCRTLEILLKSGIPILRALCIAIPTLENDIIKQEFMNCQTDLEMGQSLTSGLRKSPIIPTMMTNLIVIGEESGSLEEVLSDIAQAYEQEANEIIKTMTTLLEPVMILIIGSIVGFIVIAMLLPIFQIDVMAR